LSGALAYYVAKISANKRHNIQNGQKSRFSHEKGPNAKNPIFIVTMTQLQKLTACTWWPNPVENRDEGLDHKTSANF